MGVYMSLFWIAFLNIKNSVSASGGTLSYKKLPPEGLKPAMFYQARYTGLRVFLGWIGTQMLLSSCFAP